MCNDDGKKQVCANAGKQFYPYKVCSVARFGDAQTFRGIGAALHFFWTFAPHTLLLHYLKYFIPKTAQQSQNQKKIDAKALNNWY